MSKLAIIADHIMNFYGKPSRMNIEQRDGRSMANYDRVLPAAAEITAIQKKYSKHKTFYKGLQFVLEVTYRRRQEELKNLNLASANF